MEQPVQPEAAELEDDPAEHVEQPVLPTPPEYLPASQSEHEELAGELLNFPGPQSSQASLLALEIFPAAH